MGANSRLGAYSNKYGIYLSIYLETLTTKKLRAGRQTHATNSQEYPLGRKVNDFIVNEAYRDGGL